MFGRKKLNKIRGEKERKQIKKSGKGIREVFKQVSIHIKKLTTNYTKQNSKENQVADAKREKICLQKSALVVVLILTGR